MECTKVRKLLSAYVDGELSMAESVKVEKHVSSCDLCREELGDYYKMGSFIKSSFTLSEEVDFSASIMRKIKAEAPSSVKTQKTVPIARKKRLIKPFIAAACMFVLTGAAVVGLNSGNEAIAEADGLESYVYQHVDAVTQVDFNGADFVLVHSE